MTITHDDAETIGADIVSKWAGITGHDAPSLPELTWADIVQRIMFKARELRDERERAEG